MEKLKIRVRRSSEGKRRALACQRSRRREAACSWPGVVHTPGRRVAYPEHCSVVWPPDDPVNTQVADWPHEIQAAFAACFTGEEEGWEE